ncbi:MAG: hypothetical protein GY757_12525, partial [bacterium]|nr:hypothetical protein [bacterium]
MKHLKDKEKETKLPGDEDIPLHPKITLEVIEELCEMSREKDGKIKKEDFVEFLKQKSLMSHKKEIVSHLGTKNIKIMRKKNILKPERLKMYNDFLTTYKKELRAIIRRAKKNFGIVESTFIYSLFDNDEAFKSNLKLLKHYLKDNEVKIIKIPKAKQVRATTEKSEIVGDPVRQYLREMGNVNLLS